MVAGQISDLKGAVTMPCYTSWYLICDPRPLIAQYPRVGFSITIYFYFYTIALLQLSYGVLGFWGFEVWNSEVRISEERDSEVRDSEVRDSEVWDFEVRNSEVR